MAYIVKTEESQIPGFRWVMLKKLHYVDAHGTQRKWEMAERIVNRSTTPTAAIPNGVAVVALVSSEMEKDNDHIVLVSQFRPPIGKDVLELPAGLVDDGEDEATAALRELREETGFEGVLTHVSPIVYSDPGLTNGSLRYVFTRIDGDLGSNQAPVAMPDVGEIITVYKVPVKRLLDEIEGFRERGFEIDARLYALALGIQFGELKAHKPMLANRPSWMWSLASMAVGSFLLYRYCVSRSK